MGNIKGKIQKKTTRTPAFTCRAWEQYRTYLAVDVLPQRGFALIAGQVMFCSLFSYFKSNLPAAVSQSWFWKKKMKKKGPGKNNIYLF